MKKRVFIALIVALLLLGLMGTTPAAGVATVFHGRQTVDIADFWVFNQCTGEWVVCEGTVRYISHEVIDSAGGWHWMVRGNHNLTCVGPWTGNKYGAISTYTMHFNDIGPNCPYEWTFINTSPLISQGEVTNMIFTIRNHLTINANGDWTVSFSEIDIDCRG